MIEQYKEHVVFYVYRRQENHMYQLVGRIVYDIAQLAPLKKEYWPVIKVNALKLGQAFGEQDEFLKRFLAVKEWRKQINGIRDGG